MTAVGEALLLLAFVAAGYAAFACGAGERWQAPRLRRAGAAAAWVALLALTGVGGILVWALATHDFRFAYVVQYSSRTLPWQTAMSAFWVGQAGSLLLWTWFLALLACAYRFWPRRIVSPLREPAFAIVMAYLACLVAIMVFGADPMAASLSTPRDGAGLSPMLQHPAMLWHPPVIFLGYAGWTIPFALAIASLVRGRGAEADVASNISSRWTEEARPWALFSWSVLGLGILLGAHWAYEELGWGGYWSWDPVENGSLIPWLTGTALLHAGMAWGSSGTLKKSALLLALATFAMCNFAAFLTRSGIFSSVHAFSQSPLGWMFLALMVVPAVAMTALVLRRRGALRPDAALDSVSSRESLVAISIVVLLLLAAAALVGTLSIPLSENLWGERLVLSAGFYNHTLLATGLVILAMTAAAPLTRWRHPPGGAQLRRLGLAFGLGGLAAAGVFLLWRQPRLAAVVGLAVAMLVAVVSSWLLDAARRSSAGLEEAASGAIRDTAFGWRRFLTIAREQRRKYAGYLHHVALACLALGIAGATLATDRRELTLHRGKTVQYEGHAVRYTELRRQQLPDKLVFEAELEVTPVGHAPYLLRPAQHLHYQANEWTAEVAIHSDWRGDFYTILHRGEGEQRIHVTLAINPLMRWLWLSGWLAGAAALIGLWPRGGRAAPVAATQPATPPRPAVRRQAA